MKGNQLYLSGFQKDLNKPPKRQGFYLTLDKLILSGVIIILLFALSFSLGVEKGRNSTASISVDKPNQELLKPETEEITSQAPASKDKPETISIELNPDGILSVQKPSHDIQAPKQDLTEDNKQNYRIQVASFKKEESAQKETAKLQGDGFNAYYYKSGQYMVIYVGGFEDKRSAEKNKKILEKKYKDCILKEPRRL
ncbi:MAG: SPOR domain-containing protein [Candidatus Omnitrophica bacterium]|nr:SPOR domain-containing protein [Candidatus Omnitrophota bacterium]